jgi:Caspase domain
VTRALACLIAVIMCAASALAAGARKPKVLAFVVGVENYENADLNKLIYAADDARSVYHQLDIVSELDKDSQIFVADDADASNFTDGDLRKQLRLFSRKIKDNNMNIVVYLGGHGTLSPAKELWYLPSNYDPVNQLNEVPFAEILKYFTDQVATSGIYGTNITFLVNICGAGNAEALANPALRGQNVDDEDELITESQKLYRKLQFGKMSLAIVPATPRDRNAFEDDALKSSRFAHYLIEGMKGRAATNGGELTTGSLFAYIEKELGETLPKNTGFAANVKLGTTNQSEGRANLELGTALYSAAEALRVGGTLTPEEQTDHVSLLRDLALMHLDQVESRNAGLGPRAKLRKIQVNALRGETSMGADVMSERDLKELDERELKQFRELSEAERTSESMRDVRDSLSSNPAAKALVLYDEPEMGSKEVSNWTALLKNLVGKDRLFSHRLDAAGPRDSSWTDRIEQFRKADEALPASNGRSPLVIVYTGRADLRSIAGNAGPKCKRNERKRSCDLVPIGIRELRRIQEIWGAPFTFIHDAPFGGHLLGQKSTDAALLVGASELNGMTFLGGAPGSSSSSSALLKAFEEGADDPAQFPAVLQTMELFQKTALAENSEFVVGTPRWQPRGNLLKKTAQEQIGNADSLAFHVASGCLSEPESKCATAVEKEMQTGDPLQNLRAASQLDLEAKPSEAADKYSQALETLQHPLSATDAPGAGGARDHIAKLSDLIKKRLAGVQGKIDRTVTLVTLGVENYQSPLIADLNGTAGDIAAYKSLFSTFFDNDGNVHVEFLPLKPESDAATVIRELKRLQADAKDRPGDLIVFVFSGRGTEQAGRRYLVTSAAGTDEEADIIENTLPDGSERQEIAWSPGSLIDLADIAGAVQGTWFLGIYDAQFTYPVLDGKVDGLLQKHVDSVRPGPAAPSTPVQTQNPALVAAPRGQIGARQVHVWFEGKLTQSSQTHNECLDLTDGESDLPASPLASAAAQSAKKFTQGTYRQWLEVVASKPCLGKDWVSGALTAQGDLDVPFLASGDGAELVHYFQNGSARGELNLTAAAALARDVLTLFPNKTNRLSLAALLVALIQQNGDSAELLGAKGKLLSWSIKAKELLKSDEPPLDDALLAEGGSEAELEAMRIELDSRLDLLNGKPDRARDILSETPSLVLARRQLPKRLADIAGEALRRQPAEVLGQVNSKILELPKDNASRQAAVSSLATLIDEERTRRGEPYRIGPIAPPPVR